MIVGTRGSGKSHTLGVLAEELMRSRLAVGCVIIDRCGVFTQMDQPSDSAVDPIQDDSPRVRVLTVGGRRGDSLRFRPRNLLPADWCHLTGITTEGPRSELISEALQLVIKGYGRVDGKSTAGTGNPSVEDLWQCCASAERFLDAQHGFTLSTRRSVIQKLQALDRLAILDCGAEPIESVVLPGWVAIVDISDPRLSDVAATACVDLIAGAILRARFESVRDGQDKVPITWLLIDEAHLFAGTERGARSRADEDIVQYCKLGRQPGCALVLATQQPGAMNPAFLSQADFAIAHRLTLRSDMDALGKVVPGIDASVRNRLAGFDQGQALLFENSGRADIPYLRIRNRYTRHNGHSAVPGELSAPLHWQSADKSHTEIAMPAEISDDKALDNDRETTTTHNSKTTPLHHTSREEDTMRRIDSQRSVLAGWFGVAVILLGFFVGWKATDWISQWVNPNAHDEVSRLAQESPQMEALPEDPSGLAPHQETVTTADEPPSIGAPEEEDSSIPEVSQTEQSTDPKSVPIVNGLDTSTPVVDKAKVAKEAQNRNMNALRYLR